VDRSGASKRPPNASRSTGPCRRWRLGRGGFPRASGQRRERHIDGACLRARHQEASPDPSPCVSLAFPRDSDRLRAMPSSRGARPDIGPALVEAHPHGCWATPPTGSGGTQTPLSHRPPETQSSGVVQAVRHFAWPQT
jgi:hypothetical protein